MRRLGLRTAELHKSLAVPTQDPAFAVETLDIDDVNVAAADARKLAEKAFRHVEKLVAESGGDDASPAALLLSRRKQCMALIDTLAQNPIGAVKTRIHGDYHLGQVLVVKDDVIIVDFEGEPSRPLAERRAKSSPMRDIAGMLRSFAYAIATAKREMARRVPDGAAATERLDEELVQFSKIFIESYMESVRGSPVWIEDEPTRRRLLVLHLIAKAFYEIDYEAGNRPDWINIPIEGVIDILDRSSEDL